MGRGKKRRQRETKGGREREERKSEPRERGRKEEKKMKRERGGGGKEFSYMLQILSPYENNTSYVRSHTLSASLTCFHSRTHVTG